MAIGLTPVQVYRYVLLPVSFRIIIPPLTSDFLGVFKNSSLALTIGVLELTAMTRLPRDRSRLRGGGAHYAIAIYVRYWGLSGHCP